MNKWHLRQTDCPELKMRQTYKEEKCFLYFFYKTCFDVSEEQRLPWAYIIDVVWKETLSHVHVYVASSQTIQTSQGLRFSPLRSPRIYRQIVCNAI